ncbi:hypothetical protein [Phenylobacterium sp.]|uniref:hypothetical protein n=1 Tax=Phenylobacterium sp. TaxID=1871053 RepID=UPI0026006A7E|nr:hypothetical protein [Phenylobacterium sp.]
MNADEIRPPARGNAPHVRTAGRLGSEYFLRSFLLIAEATGGRPIHAMVLIAIVDANVAYLDDPRNAHLLPADGPPPDALRRPASTLAVASRLGLPYETVRRAVAALVREGLCLRVRRGFVVPEATLSSPRFDSLLTANLGNLRRLYRRLEASGLFAGT